MANGFRTKPLGGIAAPPYTNGPYTFSEDITFEGQIRSSPGKYCLEEYFKQKPALNAVIGLPGSDSTSPTAAAFAAYTIANKDFEVLGTNATTALVTFNATNAGITLTSAGADNDQIIILPHLDTNQTAWSAIKWGTENQTVFECSFKTGASIATELIWIGLKLTNTPVIATDNDQVFFRYSTDDSDANWMVISSIGGTDTSTDSEVAVVLSTQYNFRIEIDSSRKAHCYINDVEVYTTAALTNDVDFIPYVGIQALDTAAVTGILNYVKMNRILFE